MTSVANRSTIAANTSRSGKNKLTEIGNVLPICGTPTSPRPRPHLAKKNSRLCSLGFPTWRASGSPESETDFNELGNAHSHLPAGYGVHRSSFHHLLCHPTP